MTLHNTLWRNLAIVGLIAAALTAAGEGGSQVTDILFLILRVLFLLALGGLALTVWRQNRGTFGLMPLRSQVLLYGSVIGHRAADRDRRPVGGLVPARRAALLPRPRRLGYVLYRCWQESRRYLLLKHSYSARLLAHRRARARPPPVASPRSEQLANAPTRLHQTRATACGRVVRASCPPPPPRPLRRPTTCPTLPTPVTLLLDGAVGVPVARARPSDWGEATTGPEDADPLPSCTGSTGFRSMWYSLAVTEAAVLRVTVVSTDPVRFQPVVNVLSPSQRRGRLRPRERRQGGATANATAYVTPGGPWDAADLSRCAWPRSRTTPRRAACPR